MIQVFTDVVGGGETGGHSFWTTLSITSPCFTRFEPMWEMPRVPIVRFPAGPRALPVVTASLVLTAVPHLWEDSSSSWLFACLAAGASLIMIIC